MVQANISAGKSINCALRTAGWRASSGRGIEEVTARWPSPTHGRMLHPVQGELGYQRYGEEGQAITPIAGACLTASWWPSPSSRRDHPLQPALHRHRPEHGHRPLRAYADEAGEHRDRWPRFGSDGAFLRRARPQMQLSTDRLSTTSTTSTTPTRGTLHPAGRGRWPAWRSTPCTSGPAAAGHAHRPAQPDGSFTCTLFPLRGQGVVRQPAIEGRRDGLLPPGVPRTRCRWCRRRRGFRQPHQPAGDREVLSLGPLGDKLALIGDAAHAIVPFYGRAWTAGSRTTVLERPCSTSTATTGTRSRRWLTTSSASPTATRSRTRHPQLLCRRPGRGPALPPAEEDRPPDPRERHPDKWLPPACRSPSATSRTAWPWPTGWWQEEVMARDGPCPTSTDADPWSGTHGAGGHRRLASMRTHSPLREAWEAVGAARVPVPVPGLPLLCWRPCLSFHWFFSATSKLVRATAGPTRCSKDCQAATYPGSSSISCIPACCWACRHWALPDRLLLAIQTYFRCVNLLRSSALSRSRAACRYPLQEPLRAFHAGRHHHPKTFFGPRLHHPRLLPSPPKAPPANTSAPHRLLSHRRPPPTRALHRGRPGCLLGTFWAIGRGGVQRYLGLTHPPVA